MESELRIKKLPLNIEFKNNARQFSFEMAAYIAEYKSPVSFGKEINIQQAPFKTVSINSFHIHGTEINKIKFINNKHIIYIERLAIAGLNAPLPTPYSELIFRRTMEKDNATQMFINIFNTRLLGISYRISKRRYLCLQSHNNENSMLIKSIAAFSGDDTNKNKYKLSRLAYLFWTKEKSAAGLEALISSVFTFEVKVNQFHPFWINICTNNILGYNITIGKNANLGKQALMSSYGIEIELTHKNYAIIYMLLFDRQYFNKMKLLIRKYIGDFFLCYLKIKPEISPPLILQLPAKKLKTSENTKYIREIYSSTYNTSILGRTSWFPSNNHFDAIRIQI